MFSWEAKLSREAESQKLDDGTRQTKWKIQKRISYLLLLVNISATVFTVGFGVAMFRKLAGL